jgi:hypothetical protein
MIFQSFYGLHFFNNELNTIINDECTQTWDHVPSIEVDTDYAFVWSQGKTLEQACPPELLDEFQATSKKIKNFFKSFRTVGLKVSSCDIRQIIPEKLIIKHLRQKNKICEHIFETHKKPENYDFMSNLHKFCVQLEQEPLNINFKNISSVPEQLQRCSQYIKFDPYKAITGRLTTKPWSFPIHNLKKDYRALIEPSNNCLIELDYNACELRVLLSILGKEQPDIDIHQWNATHIFKQDLSREEIKKKTFSWLYNEKSLDKALDFVYSKQAAKLKHFKSGFVETLFKRKIETKEDNALNYIIQSTASDLFLRQAIKINKILENRASNILFTLHDSLIIDFSFKDKSIIKELINVFSNTELGKFKVNTSAGKNFGNMKELNL